MLFIALLLTGCFLAFTNGANDNFKGVASIYGSGTACYRVCLWWATLTTALGSVASIFLAQTLLRKFSGKGLVPDALTASPGFLLAVAIGAGLTVLLATRFGFPISTTHALLGAMVGSGVLAAGVSGLNFAALGKGFVTPLLLSPVLAVLIGAIIYFALHGLRWSLRIPKEWCVCVGTEQRVVAIPQGASLMTMNAAPTIVLAESETVESCAQRYAGTLAGIDSQRAVDSAHFLSAGTVSFARGLNDTPKIAALLLLVKWLTPTTDIAITTAAIAIGGLLGARRIAETMGRKITEMNPGQGFSANIATALLVVLASVYGLPVSTTHVSVGSLFGIGLLTRQARLATISGIVLSWIITLPCAAVLGSAAYLAIHALT